MSSLEIACDESGSEGENVVGSHHTVFCHGSTDLSVTESEALIDDLRARLRSPAKEIKAAQLLTTSKRQILEWALDPGGPLHQRASMYLVDKEYFATAKVVDLLVEELANSKGIDLYGPGTARRLAWALHREGRRALGEDCWHELLSAFNSLMRLKQRAGSKTTVQEFFDVVAACEKRCHRRKVSDVLEVIAAARPHADDFQDRLIDHPKSVPSLDPLGAAIPMTARHWYELKRVPITLVHDEQAMLTPPRVREIVEHLNYPLPEFARLAPRVRLAAISQVSSSADSRVQVADLIAGVGRWAATRALNDRDVEASGLIRPFVNSESLWSDDASWRLLTGRPGAGR